MDAQEARDRGLAMARAEGIYVKVQGKCPEGCGETLFLGAEGYVTCSYLSCPDPEAVTKLLERDPRKVDD